MTFMPNFRAIGQSVWEKNGNRQTETQTERQKHRNTDLNFIKIDMVHKNWMTKRSQEVSRRLDQSNKD